MGVICFFAAMISEDRKNFLRSVASELVRSHGHQLQDVIVVLPSRRARLFLLDHLSNALQRPFWAPQCIIMPQLVSMISGERIAGKMEALCLMYEVYSKVSAQPESFLEFFRWGKILLSDFHDVDASLTDPATLFSDLRDVREIENWSFHEKELSDGQQNFLKFWSEIGELYQGFYHEQQQRGKRTYHAMVKSLVLEPHQRTGTLNAKELVFAGISAFSKAEEKLIYRLMDQISIKIFHDLDEFYLDDKMHEAGALVRKSGLPVHSFVDRYFKDIPKKIAIHECSTTSSEVLAVVSELKNATPESLNETAVVLADMSSLELLMNSLTLHNVQINLGMGMPIKSHAYWRWLNVVMKMYTGKGKRGIHYRDLLESMQLFANAQIADDADTMKQISTSHMVYYQMDDLEKWIQHFSAKEKIISLCDRNIPVSDFLDRTLGVVLELPAEDDLERAAVDALSRLCESMLELISKFEYFNSKEFLMLLFHEVSSEEKVLFEGEPVRGLQILDMVESRALDFKNLLIVGANENNLPGKGDYQSMIPFDLRQHYGLPMPQDREAMFAYNTYRLLQRAENIGFYYATVSGDFRSTERSRYITQLEYALPELNALHQITNVKMRVKEFTKHDRKVKADVFSEKRLDELFASGISPSAINKFINCPLDFYYRYILGLGEEESPEEKMTVADFGTLIHDVLEDFYNQHMGSYPSSEDLKLLAQDAEVRLRNALIKREKIQQVDGGYNYLAIRIAQKMIEQFVSFEQARLAELSDKNLQPKVAAVESVLFKQINHQQYEWTKPVALKGKADRIDELAGKYLIIDYKTGKVDEKNTTLKKNKSLFASHESAKQLQLAAYILMYATKGISLENIEAGFYSFRKYKSGYQILKSDEVELSEFVTQFEAEFMDWVKSVYETQVFEHRAGSEFCEFCG